MRELARYFEDIIRILGDELGAQVIGQSELLQQSHLYGRLLCSLQYPDGSRLHIQLWADCAGDPVVWSLYGFQYLAPDNSLRFRFDTAPHHPDLPNFPHHLHLPLGVKQGVAQPRAREIAVLIKRHLDEG